MSHLQTFLDTHQLSAAALLRASNQLEAYRLSDRVLARQRARQRQRAPGESEPGHAGLAKPRSGRPLSAQQLSAALLARPLPPKVRGKLLRAVNALLARRGVAPVQAPALFGPVPVRRGSAARSG
jgi:hypothetical protein